VPVETAVTNPVLVTVATFVAFDDHVAEFVTSCVELSENVAFAESCWFCPAIKVTLDGDTVTPVTV